MKKIVKEIVSGYCGTHHVIAHLYPGQDSGLNFYETEGKKYIGNARFTKVLTREKKEY